MRLSDYKNEEALDLLADLMEYVAEILSDDATMEVYKKEKQTVFIKYLIKNHKSSIIAMLARIEGTPVEDFECDFFSLPSVLLEVFNNKGIQNLFQSQEQIKESPSSGPATESTPGEKNRTDS